MKSMLLEGKWMKERDSESSASLFSWSASSIITEMKGLRKEGEEKVVPSWERRIRRMKVFLEEKKEDREKKGSNSSSKEREKKSVSGIGMEFVWSRDVCDS